MATQVNPKKACKVKVIDLPEGKAWHHVKGFFGSQVINDSFLYFLIDEFRF